MSGYLLEFALSLAIFVLALGVALALIVFGAFCVIWAITRGYLEIQPTTLEDGAAAPILSPASNSSTTRRAS